MWRAKEEDPTWRAKEEDPWDEEDPACGEEDPWDRGRAACIAGGVYEA